jgi:MFS family permease
MSFGTHAPVILTADLCTATSQNSSMFIAERAITGTGAAGTFSASYLVIALSSSPKIRPVLQSSLSAVFAIASIVGPLIGGR